MKREFLLFLLMLISKRKKEKQWLIGLPQTRAYAIPILQQGRRVKNNVLKILNDEIYNAVIWNGKIYKKSSI